MRIPQRVASGAAGLPVAVVNARQIRDFARSMGILAKTDRLDALVIARFGKAADIEARGAALRAAWIPAYAGMTVGYPRSPLGEGRVRVAPARV